MTDITQANQKTQDLRAMLDHENEKRALINEFIEKNLTAGTDFGSIEIRGVQSKPSLFKPGSEKMCNLFRLTPKFERDDDTWEMLGKKAGVICFKCELVDQTGKIVGEGRGTATTAIQADFDVNKQVKIAEKRAQIDAVLRVFALSERFTQDIEDMPKEESKPILTTQPTQGERKPTWNQQVALEKFIAGHPLEWANLRKKYGINSKEEIVNEKIRPIFDEVFQIFGRDRTPQDVAYPKYNVIRREFQKQLEREETI